MRTPYRCPACLGNGKQNAGFYEQVGGYWAGSSAQLVDCRSCNGTGVVWDGATLFVPAPVVTPVPEVPGPWPGAGCGCPQELKDGKTYVGDNFCPTHGQQYITTCGREF